MYFKKYVFYNVIGLFILLNLTGNVFASTTLKEIQARGFLKCGVNTGLAGFSIPDKSGQWSGFDVDFCKALAVAIFNDVTKVSITPLTAKDRFTLLQNGEIDVLSRNTTWTFSRDTKLGLNWAGVRYYDGQGFLVRKSLKISSALELSGSSICVLQGTSSEANLADYFRSNNMDYKVITVITATEGAKIYDANRCDVLTSDASQLYSLKNKLINPSDHIILPEIISKEPLSPGVRHGDDQWLDIVTWVHNAMVAAEEYGINSKNVLDMKDSTNPAIRRLLGIEGDLGKYLDLSNDWVVNVIQKVGNYGEVFERNIGKDSSFKIKRGLNDLWNKGGLQYSPPWH